jgi:hypothetical protein
MRSVTPERMSRRIEALWSSAAWRQLKRLLDALMIVGVVFAVAWAATNGVFVARRAYTNRTIVQVHLANSPVVIHSLNGAKIAAGIVQPVILHGRRTVHVAFVVENEGPDGVVLRSGTLSGPFLAGPTPLEHTGSGYVAMRQRAAVTGTVTVDCDAAAGVSGALAALDAVPPQAPTVVTLTVNDADHTAHQLTMTLDTTAAALQGQVCLS